MPRTLKNGLSALGSGSQSFEEGSHLCFMYLKKRRKKEVKEPCHKLLLVLGGDLVLTRSKSEGWQVARIWLCGRGAVRGALKNLKCPLAARACDL